MMLTRTLNPWKILLGLLVAMFLAGMMISFIIAARRVSRVVDVDYYTHGLHYGKTPKGTVNRGMGWTMSATLQAGNLQVQVRDENGAPIKGGSLRFQADGVAAPGHGSGACCTLALAETEPGVFSGPRPEMPGELHGTLLFTRGESLATQKVVFFN